MIRKETIVYIIFTACLLYIVSPWFFAKKLLFNELLSLTGLLLLIYKRFRIGSDSISICMVFLLLWGCVHGITSLLRMDTLYYYLRNLVIVYSMMAFFIGYYSLPYLPNYLKGLPGRFPGTLGFFFSSPFRAICLNVLGWPPFFLLCSKMPAGDGYLLCLSY